VNRTSVSAESTADPTAVLYVDDDQLLLDLQADIADEREAVELVTTPNTDRAMALLDDHEFDCVIVGSRRTVSTVSRFAREVHTKYPDTTLVRYTWEPWEDDSTTEVFDAVLKKQVRAAETVQFLDRVRLLDD
jgi:DNA-binding NtrC family response regulator